MTTVMKNENAVAARTTKLVSVGRAWINQKPTGNQPPISGQIDRDFTSIVSLGANDRIFFFANIKREGSKDADFRMAIELPIAEADALIEAQTAHRGSVKVSSNAVEMAVASLEIPH